VAILYSDQGDNDKAIESYQKAIDINPSDATAFVNMGNAYSAKGDNDKAIEYYQKAIDINPSYADAFVNRALLILQKEIMTKR
jgi:tetratricopeptide (TPR) repeat protein